MSLADELLADLEENDEVEEDEPMDIAEAEDIKEEKPDIKNIQLEQDTSQITSVRELCKLRDSNKLANIIEQINQYVQKPRKNSDIVGPVETDPEYQLIVEANNIAADIDNEIMTIHKFVRDKYQKRFPNSIPWLSVLWNMCELSKNWGMISIKLKTMKYCSSF